MHPLFLCPNCGTDTLTRPHATDCPNPNKDLDHQTQNKARELGIYPDPQLYQLPLRLEAV